MSNLPASKSNDPASENAHESPDEAAAEKADGPQVRDPVNAKTPGDKATSEKADGPDVLNPENANGPGDEATRENADGHDVRNPENAKGPHDKAKSENTDGPQDRNHKAGTERLSFEDETIRKLDAIDQGLLMGTIPPAVANAIHRNLMAKHAIRQKSTRANGSANLDNLKKLYRDNPEAFEQLQIFFTSEQLRSIMETEADSEE